MCTLIGMDYANNLSYRACSLCGRTLPHTANNNTFCKFCHNKAASSSSKRLFRILVSLIGLIESCLADLLMTFSLCQASLHPFAAANAAKILEGGMFRMTLSKTDKRNAQHLRDVSVVPLRSGFKPAIESLKEFYGVKPATS